MPESLARHLQTSRRKFLQRASLLPAALYLNGCATPEDTVAGDSPNRSRIDPTMGRTMIDQAAIPLDTVRIGVIGAGRRGVPMMKLLLAIDGVEIRAVADPYAPAIENTRQLFHEHGATEPVFYEGGEEDFRNLLARDDIDAVYIATPWQWHTPMAVAAMRHGKHALVEVPAALTVDECWELVETSERTRLHCMMMENVCYGREELMALNMVRQGVLGELLHGEAAYIHELRWQMKDIEEGTGSWRTAWHAQRNANLYPTHGLGPIAQYMNINRGDRFDYLVSMSGPSRGLQRWAREHYPPDAPQRQERYVLGDVNVSLIRTATGRTIAVTHDTNLPRPYSRIHLVQGTHGLFQGYPSRVYVEGRSPSHRWETADTYLPEFEHPLWTFDAARRSTTGHGGMDFLEDYRLIACLRAGLPTDMTVYDAAALSAVSALSEWSVANRSRPVDFPDFTRGGWRTAAPWDIVRP